VIGMSTTSKPRERLLRTASRLFYQEGLHTVGVDRLVSEASVTRATFYRHFPSKDDLIVAYLQDVDEQLQRLVGKSSSVAGPEEAVGAVFDLVGQTICSAGFRGCHFVNAAAEYPDPSHPVRLTIEEHREWFRATLFSLAERAGHPDPRYAAALCVIIHDGGLAGGELDDPSEVTRTIQRAVRELFESASS
jgi:AcrR family transcriptional regulator